jgi:hypothetical protein
MSKNQPEKAGESDCKIHFLVREIHFITLFAEIFLSIRKIKRSFKRKKP